MNLYRVVLYCLRAVGPPSEYGLIGDAVVEAENETAAATRAKIEFAVGEHEVAKADVQKIPLRQKMIERCVDDWAYFAQSQREFIQGVAHGGFKGFANMTNEELWMAYSDAGLAEEHPEDFK